MIDWLIDCMRKNNLAIRIAGSSCRPQPDVKKKMKQIFK